MTRATDDELARTATAEEVRPAAAASAGPGIGETLGRYRIERELGAGGMGVVHAAFDPDLERRVALKVLRAGGGGGEAERRLLREARAMARLTHPHVVAVYEVGSAAGRDYVAMELVDGESLREWLRAAARPVRAVVEAFRDAGRGLAAAHAAGIVHRDFKPHNVLRSRAGRIAVTDFGLAREVAAEGLAAAAPVDGSAVSVAVAVSAAVSLKSAGTLGGLTAPGALLGTPAYMAPEQWRGGAVTPATDQFAYCVALWEALTGERPYRGETLEELRDAVARGPAALDAAKLPRRLRRLLRRGLDPDPARRWPSMDALLAALDRAERGRGAVLAAGAAAALAAGAVVLAVSLAARSEAPAGAGAAVSTCAPPRLSPDAVWSPALAAELAGAPADVARWLGEDAARWREVRAQVCAPPAADAPPPTADAVAVRQARADCLDGVLARLDAVRRSAVGGAPIKRAHSIAARLIDPDVCLLPSPPRLAPVLPASAVAAIRFHRAYEAAPVAAILGDGAADPCTRALAALAEADHAKGAGTRDLLHDALRDADRCGDERMRAELLVAAVEHRVTIFADPKLKSAIADADVAVARVREPFLLGWLSHLKAMIAEASGQRAEALALLEASSASHRARFAWYASGAALSRLSLLLQEEPARALAELPAARALAAGASPEDARTLASAFDRTEAQARWVRGELAEAHRLLRAADERVPPKHQGGRPIRGTAVDVAGRPVAGALVAGGPVVMADSLEIGIQILPHLPAAERVYTDERGRFTLEHIPEGEAVVLAQHGALRSRARVPADGMRLVLEPTSVVAGRVDLGGRPLTRVFVSALAGGESTQLLHLVPVKPDGTFELGGVVHGKTRIGVAVTGSSIAANASLSREVVVGARPIEGLVMSAPAGRAVRVIVRSEGATPLSGAFVIVVDGKVQVTTMGDMGRLARSNEASTELARPLAPGALPELATQLRAGDLSAVFAHAPRGAGTVCVAGLQGDFTDPSFAAAFTRRSSEIEVRCTPLPPDASVVTVTAPPMKRLE